MAGLMAEVVEDHVRTHLVDPERHPGALDAEAVEDGRVDELADDAVGDGDDGVEGDVAADGADGGLGQGERGGAGGKGEGLVGA